MRPLLLALLLTAAAPSAFAAAPPGGRTVTGIAVDPQGQPVAGAEVWLPPEDSADEASKAGPAAVTGADGHFAVAPNGKGRLEICAPGSLTERVEAGMASAGPVTVVLRPGASISGRLVDEAGAPLAGILLEADLDGSSPLDRLAKGGPCFHAGSTAQASTDREGRFTLAPLEPGSYTIWSDGTPVEPAPVRVASGQALDGVRLAVEHSAKVIGRVTAPDGSPVPYAKVSCYAISTETDQEGRFRLNGIAPGLHRLSADDGKHSGVFRDVKLAEGENRLDLTLSDPQEIRGRVLRPDGSPAAGATVTALDTHTTATAADGTFQLTVPSFDCTCGAALTVQAAGLAPAVVQVERESGPVEIHLTHFGSLGGHVLGLRAPAGTRVYAYRWPVHAQTFADATGRFHFPELAPGTWEIKVVQEGREQIDDAVVVPGAESVLDLTFGPRTGDKP